MKTTRNPDCSITISTQQAGETGLLLIEHLNLNVPDPRSAENDSRGLESRLPGIKNRLSTQVALDFYEVPISDMCNHI